MIEVRNLSITTGDFALQGLSFAIHPAEYFVILGPTGAGKSLLLESIAGLHTNPRRSVWVRGRDISSWPPEQRDVGYVPQDTVLFPFLTVHRNILLPLRARKCLTGDALAYCDKVVRLLRIEHLLGRGVRKLSGGEKQRVALARGLVTRPKLLLLDEPYAAIDAGLRRRLWLDMGRLHRRLETTVVHVTHDLEEAFTLSERIGVIIDGRLEQIGAREHVLHRPKNERVATFLGISNVFHGVVTAADERRTAIRVGRGGYEFVGPPRGGVTAGKEIGFCVRSEDVEVVAGSGGAGSGPAENTLRGRLVNSLSHGSSHTLYFEILDAAGAGHEQYIEARLPANGGCPPVTGGQAATLSIRKEALTIFS